MDTPHTAEEFYLGLLEFQHPGYQDVPIALLE